MKTEMYSNPSHLIRELLSSHDGFDLLDLRIHQLYTGNFGDPAFSAGNWGYLPIAGLVNGDRIVLGPRFGKKMTEWEVMILAQNGDGASSFGSSPETLVSAYCAKHAYLWMDEADDRETVKHKFMELSEFFGGKEGAARTDIVLRAMADASKPFSALNLFERQILAEGGSRLTEFYRAFESAYVKNEDPAAIWRKFTAVYPDFEPGHHLYFGAALFKKLPDVLEAAYRVIALDYQYNNYYTYEMVKRFGTHTFVISEEAYGYLFDDDPRAVAASFIMESAPDAYRDDPLFPVITAIANDEPVSIMWSTAALQYEKKGKWQQAYTAWHNAAHSFFAEDESAEPEMWRGALRCARGMNDALLIALLEPLDKAE